MPLDVEADLTEARCNHNTLKKVKVGYECEVQARKQTTRG